MAFCLFSRLRSRLLAPLAVALFAWTVSLGDEGVLWPSFTALFFWPTWLLGAWVAQLHRENRLRSTPPVFTILIGSLFLVLALASHKKLQDWQVWIQYSLWTGFYLSLLLFSLRKWNPINKPTAQGCAFPFVLVGKISFSLYLVHFPLFKLIGYLHVARFGEKPANFLLRWSTWLWFVSSDGSSTIGSSVPFLLVQKQIAKIVNSKNLFVVSHPSGNTFVQALLEELNNKSLLGSFHTTIGIGLGQLLSCTAFARRSYEIEDRLISRKWFPELTRLLPFPQAHRRRSEDQRTSPACLKTKRSPSDSIICNAVLSTLTKMRLREVLAVPKSWAFIDPMSYRSPIGRLQEGFWQKKPNDSLNGNRPLKAPVNPRKS